MRGGERRPVRMRVAGLVVAGILTACGPSDDPLSTRGVLEDRRAPPPAAVIHSGRVVVPGSAGSAVSLYPAVGEPVVLAGPLELDLQALRGARVTVRGAPTPDGAVVVERYAILEINGERPVVGRVGWVGADLVLLTDQGVRAFAPGADALFRNLVGATVWATGAQIGERLVVSGYGVIRRDPPPTP